MPKQNTVTPFGELIVTEARGLFMGNRGNILDEHEQFTDKRWAQTYWITCTLHPKKPSTEKVKYTKLFFLDEATALAAGHRPCRQCRYKDFIRFVECWAEGNGYPDTISIEDIDTQLHKDRVTRYREKVTYTAPIFELPDGVFIELETYPGSAWLIWNGELLKWQENGYGDRLKKPRGVKVRVLTPESTVRAIAAGYRPHVHQDKHF